MNCGRGPHGNWKSSIPAGKLIATYHVPGNLVTSFMYCIGITHGFWWRCSLQPSSLTNRIIQATLGHNNPPISLCRFSIRSTCLLRYHYYVFLFGNYKLQWNIYYHLFSSIIIYYHLFSTSIIIYFLHLSIRYKPILMLTAQLLEQHRHLQDVETSLRALPSRNGDAFVGEVCGCRQRRRVEYSSGTGLW